MSLDHAGPAEAADRPALPEGWFYPDARDAGHLEAEFRRELPPGYLLAGREVKAFAWRDGATDDVLFRHRDAPDRFTVVHLAWRGGTEVDPTFPTVLFDGTFARFLADEERRYGLTPPRPGAGPAEPAAGADPPMR